MICGRSPEHGRRENRRERERVSLKLDLDLEGKSGASIQLAALFDPEREGGLLLAKVGLPGVSLSERVLQGSRGIEGPRPRSRIESGIKRWRGEESLRPTLCHSARSIGNLSTPKN